MSLYDTPIIPSTGYNPEIYAKVLWDNASLFPQEFARYFGCRDRSYDLAVATGMNQGMSKDSFDSYLRRNNIYQSKLSLLRRWVLRCLRINDMTNDTPCEAGKISSVMQDLLWVVTYVGVPTEGDFVLKKKRGDLGVCPENLVWVDGDAEWVRSHKVNTLELGYEVIKNNPNYPITVVRN